MPVLPLQAPPSPSQTSLCDPYCCTSGIPLTRRCTAEHCFLVHTHTCLCLFAFVCPPFLMAAFHLPIPRPTPSRSDNKRPLQLCLLLLFVTIWSTTPDVFEDSWVVLVFLLARALPVLCVTLAAFTALPSITKNWSIAASAALCLASSTLHVFVMWCASDSSVSANLGTTFDVFVAHTHTHRQTDRHTHTHTHTHTSAALTSPLRRPPILQSHAT